MPYHGSAASNRGDPFLGGLIAGIGSSLINRIRGVRGRQSSSVTTQVRRQLARPGGAGTMQVRKTGGLRGAAERFLPGGRTGYEVGLPGGRPRRKRMNYGNTRALTRASRRIDGFVKVAKRALTHTNYRIVTKQSGARRSAAARHHAS